MRRILLGIFLVIAVGCQSPTNQAKVKIMPDTWADYQKYLGLIGSTRPGAFAIGELNDNGQSYGYSYCEEMHCNLNSAHTYKEFAMKFCAEDGDTTCRIFAVGKEIIVNYEIVK